MDIQCRQISPYAKKCLQDPGYFQLLSKFEYVLNLWDGKNVLSLQTAQLQLTPLSLVLQEEDFRAVSSVLNRDRDGKNIYLPVSRTKRKLSKRKHALHCQGGLGPG